MATPTEADRVLVVDVSNLAWRSAYAYQLTTADGRFSGHVFGAVRLLHATLQNHVEPGRWCVVFCYDGPGGKAHRQAVLPAYKANREAREFNPCTEVAEALRLIPGVHAEAPGREGDDAVAWAVAKTKKPAVVLSGDRDLWALTRHPHVQVFSPNLKRMVTPQDVLEHYHVTDPERIYLAKALFGDSSDGIKGVERLLKKQVAPHLNNPAVTDVATLYDAVELAPKEVTTLTTKAKLRDNRARVEANYAVVRPLPDGFGPQTVAFTRATPENRAAFEALLTRYECKSLVARAGEFYGAEFYVDDSPGSEA